MNDLQYLDEYFLTTSPNTWDFNRFVTYAKVKNPNAKEDQLTQSFYTRLSKISKRVPPFDKLGCQKAKKLLKHRKQSQHLMRCRKRVSIFTPSSSSLHGITSSSVERRSIHHFIMDSLFFCGKKNSLIMERILPLRLWREDSITMYRGDKIKMIAP